MKETENYLVVDKPSSMPIHPAAQYRHNSLIFILAREFDINYHVVHRLDRLTSGLVIFAKNKTASQKISKQIQDREVSKEYVCRVVGKFPEKRECSAALCTGSGFYKVDQVAVYKITHIHLYLGLSMTTYKATRPKKWKNLINPKFVSTHSLLAKFYYPKF